MNSELFDLGVMDADYIVVEDSLHRNRRARAYSRRCARRRRMGVLRVLTVLGTVLSLLILTMYAFAISRKDFKLRQFLTFFAYFTMRFAHVLFFRRHGIAD